MLGDVDQAQAGNRRRTMTVGPTGTSARSHRSEVGNDNLPGAGRRLVRIWLVSSMVVFFFGALWSLATPIGAAPDEPTQIIKAAAVVRGELIGSKTAHHPRAVVRVTVPKSFANDANLATCYAGRPTVPAGCAPHLANKTYLVQITTYVGRYPPLYYLAVGLPTLLWHTNVAVYAMRLLSDLWSALLLGLALAVAAVLSRSRLLVAAVALAATPLVVFLVSVVNPSGLEISAAIATWTTGLVLVIEHRHRPPPALVAACASSATVLVLCRGLSPLWLALIAATLVALVPEAVSSLWRCRSVRIAAGVVGVCGVGAVAFIFAAHSLSVLPVGKPVAPNTSTIAVVRGALGRTGAILDQAVGVFGWLDTPSPTAVLVGWWIAVGLLVTVGLVTGRRRDVAVLVTLIVVAVALPTGIIASQAHHDGLVWQARDGMPLYVGIPLVGAAVFRRQAQIADAQQEIGVGGSALRRLLMLLVAGVALAQLVDFGWALRRYTVGLGATLNPLDKVPGGWSPPVPTAVLLLAAVASCAAYGWWVYQLTLLASVRATPAPTTGQPMRSSRWDSSNNGSLGTPDPLLRTVRPMPKGGRLPNTDGANGTGVETDGAGDVTSEQIHSAAIVVIPQPPAEPEQLRARAIANDARLEADGTSAITENRFGPAAAIGSLSPEGTTTGTAVDLDGLLLSVMTTRRRRIRR